MPKYIGAAILAVVALAMPAAASAQRLVVKTKPGVNVASVTKGATVVKRLVATPNTVVVNATPAERAALAADPRVVSVNVDKPVSLIDGGLTDLGPVNPFSNDTYFNLLWGLRNVGQAPFYGKKDADIDADAAWKKTAGVGQTVWIADTGIDYTHPDLKANYTGGYNFVNHSYPPFDDHYHGTHVSGTIAAVGGNHRGVIGVAYHAHVKALKVLDSTGSGYWSDVVDSVNYAGARKARVYSASLGGGGNTAPTGLCQAIKHWSKTLFVFAAGNNSSNNDSVPNWPSNCPSSNVIAVAASTPYDTAASFSNWGKSTVDIWAPGENIASTIPVSLGSYAYLSGTSMATPHVAGVLALELSRHPKWTAGNARYRLLHSGDAFRSAPGKVSCSCRANAARAVK